MVLNILGIGKMINNKAMANKNGKMGHFIKVITEVGKSKEMVLLFGEMTALIKVNFYRTIFMVKANMFGKMEELEDKLSSQTQRKSSRTQKESES